jgi:hypothetical protein
MWKINVIYFLAGMVSNAAIIYPAFETAVKCDDKELKRPTFKKYVIMMLAAVAASETNAVIAVHIRENDLYGAGLCTLLGVVSGCLIFASATDLIMCKVYDFTWWIAGAALCVMFVMSTPALRTICDVILFIILQELVFSRFYGRADCYAFCICALTESILGIGMEGFLVHMILSYMLLTFVQFFRKNIDRYGKLIKPVPFLPYITVTFCITDFWHLMSFNN